MPELVIDDMQDGYVSLVRQVMRDGRETSPRGMRTRDIRHATVLLRDPTRSVPVGVGRKVNTKIGAAESMQLIAGVCDAALMVRISKNFEQFVEYDRFYGGYGTRTHSSIVSVIRLLAKDPDTRQAVVTFMRPDDHDLGTKDLPCTLNVCFQVNDGRLDMITDMRSNDAVWGMTYDFWQFTNLQHAVGYALGYPVGEYVHHANSLHVYVDRDQKIVDNLHGYDGSAHPPFLAWCSDTRTRIKPATPEVAVSRWRYIRNVAEAVLGLRPTAESHGGRNNTASDWYRDLLHDVIASRGDERLCPTCRFVLPAKYFPDRTTNRARCRWCARDAHYGAPVGTYAKMMLRQQGACLLCGATEVTLSLDHDHVSGMPRGLLCHQCNVGLGLLGDDPDRMEAAAAYVRKASTQAETYLRFGYPTTSLVV